MDPELPSSYYWPWVELGNRSWRWNGVAGSVRQATFMRSFGSTPRPSKAYAMQWARLPNDLHRGDNSTTQKNRLDSLSMLCQARIIRGLSSLTTWMIH